MFMTSAGGLTAAELFEGKDAILSGPAGGVVGMVETGRAAGFDRLIGFDMGGTSTDVSHFAGEFERTFETEVAGVRMRAPMMLIHTVAAGGGSILHFDGSRLRVGPDSAGANPGPKCYRRGGPLTVTDANVMLGKLIPEFFPKIFGKSQDQPIDAEAVRAAFAVLADQIGGGRTNHEIADGFVRIAVENMANAIKKISVQRGYDVTRYALNTFGGAGGQHACLVADALGIAAVLIHPFSSLLSAYGMGLADIRATRQQAIEEPFGEGALASIGAIGQRLGGEARDEVVGQGIPAPAVSVHLSAHLRYAGTDTALAVNAGTLSAEESADPATHLATLAEMNSAFEAAHQARFGFVDRSKQLMVETIAVEAVGGGTKFAEPLLPPATGPLPRPERTTRFYSGGSWHEAAIYVRAQLAPGHTVAGPAIVIEPHQTIVVEDGWRAQITARNHLVLVRAVALKRQAAIGTKADPVMLEVFNNLFMAIAEQMGVALQNTAYSVNIKERLDFSCALFDGTGALVANAPHMPVHLGSMDRAVETVIRESAGMIAPGDVYAINAPYNGGTHLPDITVCTPVFDDAGARHPVLGREPRPSRRYRRHLARLDVAQRHHHRGGRRLYRPVQAGRPRPLLRGRALRAPHRRQISGAQSRSRTSMTSRRRSPPTRRARRNCARWWRSSACRWSRPICGTCRTMRPKACAASSTRLHDCAIRLRDGPGHLDQGEDQRRQAEARGDRRFHRHLAAAAEQLQRARAGHARRRAVCLPGHGRRRHPDECRLP